MTDVLRLHYAPDNASLCVRLALEVCDMPYETVLVDRRAFAHHSDAYRALNPHGLIPALETPRGPMFETAAILLWLSEQPGGAGLFPPPAHRDRGAALSWLFWLSNSLHPALRVLFYPGQHTFEVGVTDLLLATQDRVTAMLHRLEKMAQSGPAWLSSETPSAHLCYLCPMLRWLAIYGPAESKWFDLSRWPALLALAQAFETSPAAERAATAEGLGPTPFSSPSLPNPPEGHAL